MSMSKRCTHGTVPRAYNLPKTIKRRRKQKEPIDKECKLGNRRYIRLVILKNRTETGKKYF